MIMYDSSLDDLGDARVIWAFVCRCLGYIYILVI